MPEIGTSGSMSGDRKRGVGHRPQATAPILDSTRPIAVIRRLIGYCLRFGGRQIVANQSRRLPATPITSNHAVRTRAKKSLTLLSRSLARSESRAVDPLISLAAATLWFVAFCTDCISADAVAVLRIA